MHVASGAIVVAEKVEILPCGAAGEESWVESVLWGRSRGAGEVGEGG